VHMRGQAGEENREEEKKQRTEWPGEIKRGSCVYVAPVRTQQTYKISRSNIDQLTDYPHTHTHTHTRTHAMCDFLSFARRMSEISHGHFLSQELYSDLRRTTPVLTVHEEEKKES
jgi:hypothetical protein